jgi:predicted MFS family arabinose efflux permease
VLLAAFVFDAVRPGRSPNRATLIEVGLFRRAPYATAQITVFFTGLSLFGGLILLPLYYEKLRGIPVIQTGLLLLAYGAGAMIALIVGGRLTDRFGSGITCIIGLLITIGATLPFVFLPQNVSLLNVEVLQGLRGLGIGMAGIPAMTATMRAAGGHMADATTTANILQRVGGSLGSAIIVIVIARSTPDIVGFQAAHGILVITAVLALVASASLAISERRHAQSMASTPTQ